MGELANFFVTVGTKYDPAGLNKIIDDIEAVEKKTENLTDGFKIMGATLAGIATAGVVAINSLARSFGEGETANLRFSNALKTVGQYSKVVYDDMLDYANALQKVTKYSDEQIKSGMTLMTQLGVAPGLLKEATNTALDLASALGMDLSSASTLVAKALDGNVTMLGRYGIKLDETRVKAGDTAYILGELNKKFGGSARAEVAGYEGSLARLANRWDELKETLGQYIIPLIAKFTEGINKLFNWFESLTPTMKEAIAQTLLYGTAITGVSGATLLLLGYLPTLISSIEKTAGAFKVLMSITNPYVAVATAVAGAIMLMVEAYGKLQQSRQEAINADLAECRPITFEALPRPFVA